MRGRGLSQDAVAGGLIALAGVAIAVQALANYRLGSFQRMGPGLFPLTLGGILVVLGLLVLVPALSHGGPKIAIRKRVPLAVLGSVLAFAFLVKPTGMVPAVAATVLIASLAERPFRPLQVALLSVFLIMLVYIVFRLGLGVQIPLWRWRF